jgi:putative endonuclease
MGLHLPAEFSTATPVVSRARRDRGRLAALSGAMAEDSVHRQYLKNGAVLRASRWRGKAGEIDLIFQDGDDLVFVEVKKAATHAIAGERLRPAQMARICRAACEYCDVFGLGSAVPMRFDAALVDQSGRVELIENAFGEV